MTGTNGEGLKEILESINKGETQLPDFQRGWVWSDDRIRGLIASITNGYPVGAAMFLDCTGKNLHFKHRVVEGVKKSEYIKTIENKQPINVDTVNHFISSHSINVDSLRSDDFDTFYKERADSLCELIEDATGKSVDGKP